MQLRPYQNPVHEYHSLTDNMVMLPTQLLPARVWTGAQGLFAALLQEAIQTAFRPRHIPGYSPEAMRRRRANIQKDAWDWILSEDESYLCSFRRACFALQIDPDWLRAQVCTQALKTRRPRHDT